MTQHNQTKELTTWFLRDDSGDSAGSGPEEAPIGLWPEAAQVGEGGAPPVRGEPCTSFRIGGFEGCGAVFST
jgi:hypothetical protein